MNKVGRLTLMFQVLPVFHPHTSVNVQIDIFLIPAKIARTHKRLPGKPRGLDGHFFMIILWRLLVSCDFISRLTSSFTKDWVDGEKVVTALLWWKTTSLLHIVECTVNEGCSLEPSCSESSGRWRLHYGWDGWRLTLAGGQTTQTLWLQTSLLLGWMARQHEHCQMTIDFQEY